MFGIKKGSAKVLDTITSLAGMASKYSFTNEERAEFNKSMADATVEFAKETANENTVRSVTRRKVATGIIYTWLFLIVSAAYGWLYNPEWAKHLISVIVLMTGAALSVVAFFFGGYYLKGPIQAVTNRFKRKSKQADGGK